VPPGASDGRLHEFTRVVGFNPRGQLAWHCVELQYKSIRRGRRELFETEIHRNPYLQNARKMQVDLSSWNEIPSRIYPQSILKLWFDAGTLSKSTPTSRTTELQVADMLISGVYIAYGASPLLSRVSLVLITPPTIPNTPRRACRSPLACLCLNWSNWEYRNTLEGHSLNHRRNPANSSSQFESCFAV
jgi:hypothetical protein